MSYQDRLRRLAIHGVEGVGGPTRGVELEPGDLDPKALALARLAALIGVSGSASSYGALTDDAVNAGATPEECVDVLEGIIEIVGLPRVVEASPNLAIALGYDIDDAMEGPPMG